MWRTEGARGDDAVSFASEGVDFGDGDLFFGRGRWQEIGGGTSEESFASARRPRNENVVMASNSNGESAFSEVLAADVV